MSCIKYVCADMHLRHYNNALRRGFKSCEEHDDLIIKNWNSIVRPSDIVYVLGDLTMEKKSPYPILNELNGIKYVALGNHEKRQDVNELLKYVNGVASCFEIKGSILTHIPIHPCELKRYRSNIHGHLHEKTVGEKGYFCVSMEHIDYKPIPLDIALKRANF